MYTECTHVGGVIYLFSFGLRFEIEMCEEEYSVRGISVTPPLSKFIKLIFSSFPLAIVIHFPHHSNPEELHHHRLASGWED